MGQDNQDSVNCPQEAVLGHRDPPFGHEDGEVTGPLLVHHPDYAEANEEGPADPQVGLGHLGRPLVPRNIDRRRLPTSLIVPIFKVDKDNQDEDEVEDSGNRKEGRNITMRVLVERADNRGPNHHPQVISKVKHVEDVASILARPGGVGVDHRHDPAVEKANGGQQKGVNWPAVEEDHQRNHNGGHDGTVEQQVAGVIAVK